MLINKWKIASCKLIVHYCKCNFNKAIMLIAIIENKCDFRSQNFCQVIIYLHLLCVS